MKLIIWYFFLKVTHSRSSKNKVENQHLFSTSFSPKKNRVENQYCSWSYFCLSE